VKQAEELAIVCATSRVTTIDGYSREMTALAEATLAAGWLLAQEPLVERYGVPRDASGRFIPAVIVGLGKLGGRELVTGSDSTCSSSSARTARPTAPSGSTPTGSTAWRPSGWRACSATSRRRASPSVDLRLRPGSKGAGSPRASRRWSSTIWSMATCGAADVDPRAPDPRGSRPRPARAPALRRLVYGEALPRPALKEIAEVRTRMERELGRETRGRVHVKYGRGGLVDVEFLVQALQLVHGHRHPDVRRFTTTAALSGLARAGALEAAAASALVERYRFLRRVSAALRLLGARPSDTLELAGPMPARVATALGYESRQAFLDAYRDHTTAVRDAYALHMNEPNTDRSPGSTANGATG